MQVMLPLAPVAEICRSTGAQNRAVHLIRPAVCFFSYSFHPIVYDLFNILHRTGNIFIIRVIIIDAQIDTGNDVRQ